MNAPDMFPAILPVIEAFEELGIGYHIGGSVASSFHGLPRSTLDVDLVADLLPEHVAPLVQRLANAFYVSEDMVRDAVKRRSSFNLLHLDTMVKVDVFSLGSTPFDRSAFARAQEGILESEGGTRSLRFASAEDTVLHKLVWYKSGGQVSERQWSDVLGVLRVQATALDREYMSHWASELKVSDLLQRALTDGGFA
ncbi:hypothetical protein JW916_12555 [Candidatus Sumerlaeota bacterium]|nr:hypothetical protein [Candidatus Sumerlaeota bacterium]